MLSNVRIEYKYWQNDGHKKKLFVIAFGFLIKQTLSMYLITKSCKKNRLLRRRSISVEFDDRRSVTERETGMIKTILGS